MRAHTQCMHTHTHTHPSLPHFSHTPHTPPNTFKHTHTHTKDLDAYRYRKLSHLVSLLLASDAAALRDDLENVGHAHAPEDDNVEEDEARRDDDGPKDWQGLQQQQAPPRIRSLPEAVAKVGWGVCGGGGLYMYILCMYVCVCDGRGCGKGKGGLCCS
jgi:hypothetical protein